MEKIGIKMAFLPHKMLSVGIKEDFFEVKYGLKNCFFASEMLFCCDFAVFLSIKDTAIGD